MRLPFTSAAPAAQQLRHPEPACIPALRASNVAALYRAARIGGDFFDFQPIAGSKLIFLLMDIAGRRDQALHIAAAAQGTFRKRSHELYAKNTNEDGESMTRLLLDLNRELIQASGGVCYAPTFLGCYDEDIGVITYVNAGHTPGILKDSDGTLLLEANGLPLGLFSHATHDSQFCALRPGAALVLVSKGVVERRSADEEVGFAKIRELIARTEFQTAQEVCSAILESLDKHEKAPSWFGPALSLPGFGAPEPNDHTTLALVRHAARVGAAAQGT
jgi:serine phosphatase RsbU (regulator of sigma subunit)